MDLPAGPPPAFGSIALHGNFEDIPASERTLGQWFNANAGFERVAGKQPSFNIRTFPLRLSGTRADGFNDWDLAPSKEFRLRESMFFQVRAEAADALNHAMFNPPNTDPSSSAFGQVTGTIWSEQRKITVASRLRW